MLHYDILRDLALIQLDRVPAGTQAIPLAKSSPRQGTTVWNIGSPGAVGQVFSVTEGKVRAVGEENHLVGGGPGQRLPGQGQDGDRDQPDQPRRLRWAAVQQ